MSLENILISWINFFDVAFAYYVIQLGRAALISACMLAVILILRKTIFKNQVFLRGGLWNILLLAPFMGKMRWIYETRIGVRILYRWQGICGDYRWISCAYIAGIVCIGTWIFRKRRNLKQTVKGLKRIEKLGFRIAVSEFAISPFTTGLFHPVIVVPEVMLQNLSDKELDMILLHERVHIRLGHLWCFFLWDLLRMILWVNPLLHICTKWFRADMEDICDYVTMQEGRQTGYAYGSLLLKSIQMLKGEQRGLEPYATFAGGNQYSDIKLRMERVAAFKPYNKVNILAVAICGTALFIAAFMGVIHISYPRYTDEDYLQLYSADGIRVAVEDCDALREAVQIKEDTIYINRDKLDWILAERNVEEETFFLYFGGFSKFPGIGGGGNGVFVEYAETDGDFVIPYINKWDLRTWLIRYM